LRRVRGKRSSGAAGFTLVELLLALSLMSMLLALAYGGLRASTRAADKGQAILEDSSRIRMAHQFVRKQLNQMAPLAFVVSADQQDRTVFAGDARKIRYVSPMPGYLGFGGPQVQELAIISGDDGDQLVLSHALLQGFEEQDLYVRDPIVLLEHIEFAEFSFLGRDEFGELTGWINYWEQEGLLPESVSLEIDFEEDVYIKWPLMTASVRVDSSALDDLRIDQEAQTDYATAIQDLINKRKER
jgi:general secretion pathway protein J